MSGGVLLVRKLALLSEEMPFFKLYVKTGDEAGRVDKLAARLLLGDTASDPNWVYTKNPNFSKAETGSLYGSNDWCYQELLGH